MIVNYNEFYRGFIPTKNKKATIKYKDVPDHELPTYNDVCKLDEFSGALRPDAVLIDVDDKEQSEILLNIIKDKGLKCKVHESRKGIHALFKNNGLIKNNHTGVKLACGLKVDIKIGKNNGIETLKIDGEERKTLYDIPESEVYQEVPKYLIPVNSKYEFYGMKESDGRNSDLFAYELTLTGNGFSKEESRECIRVINDYVLEDKLSDNELEVILRDDAFKKEIFFNGKSLMHDRFGEFLISNEHIIKVNGLIHVYDDGIYTSDIDVMNRMIRNYIPSIKKNQKSEVMDYIKDMTPRKYLSEENLILFSNGVYDITTDTMHPISPDYIITNRIPWNYNTDAYCEITDNTLNKISCNDDNVRKVIEEMIGYCMYRSCKFEKSFILTGSKSNGKSTLLWVLGKLLGDDNVTSLDLKHIGDRFNTALLAGKLANIGDDISDEFIPDASLFKKIVSGMDIQGEIKGFTPFNFTPHCKLIFSANDIPRINDKTGAVLRRLVIIPFNADFKETDSDYNPNIKKDLCSKESIEYLIRLGIQGLKRLLDNKRFTSSEKIQEQVQEYQEENNPVIQFVKEQSENMGVSEIKYLTKECVTDIRLHYEMYCSGNGYKPESSVKFGKEIKNLYGLVGKSVRIDGKVHRFYREI